MNDTIHSVLFKNPDDYLGSIINTIDWNRFVLFDNHGFKNWARNNNFEFRDATHPADSTHQLAADYILARFKF
jgi:hypothetical protein